MPRRRELNGIASNLLGSFVSRNNDVDGYWAIGKLCVHALQTPQGEISIDLLSRRSTSPDLTLKTMVDQYASRLVTSLQNQSFPIRWVTAAELLISFGEHFEPDALRPRGMLPYRCSVTLTDDLLRRHIARHSGEAWPHDPRRESRSARVSTRR